MRLAGFATPTPKKTFDRGNEKMSLYTLPEIKKEMKAIIKKGGSVSKITIDIQEYGEGFDLYVNCWTYDRWLNDEFESYTVMTEESLKKCEARAKKLTESLQSQGWKTSYEGIANC